MGMAVSIGIERTDWTPTTQVVQSAQVYLRLRVRVFWHDVGQYHRDDIIVERSLLLRGNVGDAPCGDPSAWILVGSVQ